MNKNSPLIKAGLAITAVLLSLLVAELGLRLTATKNQQYYVWQPNLSHIFTPDSGIIKGIKGPQQFTINRYGMRGDLFGNDTKNYLCIGGSTTECLYLDDTKTWWFLLQQILKQQGKAITIASIGKSGTTSRENYLHLKYFAGQLQNLDGVIVMVGLNDLYRRLNRDTLFENNFRFTKAVEDSMRQIIFLNNESAHGWRSFALVKLFTNALQQKKGVKWQLQDDNGLYIKALQKQRLHAPLIDSLPPMQNALSEFERNLDSMIAVSVRQNIKLIFITQSAMYQPAMDSTAQRLLWMGGKNDFQNNVNAAYYTPRALRSGLEMYNTKLKEVAQRAGIRVIDLDAELQPSPEIFYDDCHFNERGAQKVAEIIANHFPQ